MTTYPSRRERGQVLVLLALAAIALVGLAALAIDGGSAFADRRGAQNAADSAALAGATVNAQNGSTSAIVLAALERAQSNGYTDANSGVNNPATDVDVEVYTPPVDGPYAGNNQYVQVKIRSKVHTYLAGVLGFDTMTNSVSAVARGQIEEIADWSLANAIVALDKTAPQALYISGSSGTTVNGGGLFINSTATGPNCNGQNGKAVYLSSIVTTPSIAEVSGANGVCAEPGKVTVDGTLLSSANMNTLVTPTTQIDLGMLKLPKIPTCSSTATANANVMSPGSYDASKKAFPPNGVDTLKPGIYCITGSKGINLTGNSGLEVENYYGTTEGVMFYVAGGPVSLTGTGTYLLRAMSPSQDLYYAGMLFYLPVGNPKTVDIVGNADFEFQGSIFAPSSLIKMTGSSGNTGHFSSQAIGNTVIVTGNGNVNILYSTGDNFPVYYLPKIELAR